MAHDTGAVSVAAIRFLLPLFRRGENPDAIDYPTVIQ
jgi:hypothetical protein